MIIKTFTLTFLMMLLIPGCVPHISPYTAKKRNYKPETYDPVIDKQEGGSLWNENTDTLFTDKRSVRVGDLVTVIIQESASATRNAETDASRNSNITLGVNAFAGAMKALAAANPSINPEKLIEAMSKTEFKGKGSTQSSGKIFATLTTRIKKILSNGDLYIEGSKVVMINEEESHLYISGVIRPADIEADNIVLSSTIADAQVEYTGRGPIADKQKPGWFARFLDLISPF